MITTVVLVPVLIVVGLFLYEFLYVGVPLWDEWHCKKGQAPVDSDDGALERAGTGRDRLQSRHYRAGRQTVQPPGARRAVAGTLFVEVS